MQYVIEYIKQHYIFPVWSLPQNGEELFRNQNIVRKHIATYRFWKYTKNVIAMNTTILRQSKHCRLLKNWHELWRNLPLPSSVNPKNRRSNFREELGNFIPQRKTSHLKKANASQSLPQKSELPTRWFFELLLLCWIGQFQQMGAILTYLKD